MQTTIKFDEGITSDKLWVVAKGEEVERYKKVRDNEGRYQMKRYTTIRPVGYVCGSNGMPVVFTIRGEATIAAKVLAEHMSDQLRVFKVNGLKLEDGE